MVSTFRFAVVGAGWFGQKRIAALQKINQAAVEWTVDTNRAVAMKASKSCGSRYSTNLEDALTDQKVDCVLVCTPNNAHPAAVIAALKRGKHVLCEKPLARNAEEASSIVRASRKVAGFLKVGSNHRYFPNVVKAVELIAGGKIGNPIFFRGSIGHDGEILRGRWFWDKEMAGGGTFLDNGCHLLDISRVVLGDFDECVGMVSTNYWPVAPLEDNGFAMYSNRKSRTALIQSSWLEWYGYMYFEVYGTEGFVIVDSRRTNKTIFGRRGEEQTILYDYSDMPQRSYELELIDMIGHLRKGEQPSPSGSDGHRVVQMVDALYLSSKRGRKIAF